jgi:hypothetical protein
LESAIPIMQASLEHTPDNDPEKPYRHIMLGDAFQIRFKRLNAEADMENAEADIESAISNYRTAVHLTPDHHLAKPSRLTVLGDALMSRFKRSRNREDLDNAALSYQEAVDLTADHDYNELSSHDIITSMGNLGDSKSRPAVRILCRNEMIRTSLRIPSFRRILVGSMLFPQGEVKFHDARRDFHSGIRRGMPVERHPVLNSRTLNNLRVSGQSRDAEPFYSPA